MGLHDDYTGRSRLEARRRRVGFTRWQTQGRPRRAGRDPSRPVLLSGRLGASAGMDVNEVGRSSQ
jgi:hypothetical protein